MNDGPDWSEIDTLRARVQELEEALILAWQMGFSGESEPHKAGIDKVCAALPKP